jgi:hypothetical protein
MTEREVTERVEAVTRHGLPGSVVVKHCDVGTKGIPDMAVHVADRSSMAEFKHLKKGDTLKAKCKAQQLVFCHELGTVLNGRSWVIVFEDVPKRMTVWFPRALFAHLWPNVAGTNEGGFKTLGTEPALLESLDVDLKSILRTYGAFRINAWDYNVVAALVRSFYDA